MRNRDMPANAQSLATIGPDDIDVSYDCEGGEGKTKREEAAMRNMASILVNAGRNGYKFHEPDKIAKLAVEMADALFDELDGEES